MTGRVAAVVVHHRRYPEVLDTVAGVIAAGVPAEAVVLVDNSEDADVAAGLRSAAEAGGWRVHVVPNLGYGAAVNAAVPLLPPCEVVLVVTHEVRIDAASVTALVDAVTSDPRVGAAGPGRLLDDDGAVWSRGGVLTPRLRRPRQVVGDVPVGAARRDVDWLDGACVAYARKALADNPFREDFFLYFEETELHTRLREQGWRVVAVDGASARQGTGGMPAYWGCRNVVLFQRAHGRRGWRVVAPWGYLARQMAIAAEKRDWRGVLGAPRGLVDGYRSARGVA